MKMQYTVWVCIGIHKEWGSSRALTWVQQVDSLQKDHDVAFTTPTRRTLAHSLMGTEVRARESRPGVEFRRRGTGKGRGGVFSRRAFGSRFFFPQSPPDFSLLSSSPGRARWGKMTARGNVVDEARMRDDPLDPSLALSFRFERRLHKGFGTEVWAVSSWQQLQTPLALKIFRPSAHRYALRERKACEYLTRHPHRNIAEASVVPFG